MEVLVLLLLRLQLLPSSSPPNPKSSGYDSTNEDDEDTADARHRRKDLAGSSKYDKRAKAKVLMKTDSCS